MSPATPPSTAAVTTTATNTDYNIRRRHQPPQTPHAPATSREDFWSEDETHALIDAWGSHHLSLNRRQHQWSIVADSVNSAAATSAVKRRRSRTGVQCKNRIDTLKKRYKGEKAKAKIAGDDRFVSSWRYFSRLDFLMSAEVETPVAVAPVRWPMKRRTAMRTRPARWLREEREVEGDGGGGGGGWREVASAMRRVGEVYERVEAAKQRQLMELERERIKFVLDLESQRINFFVDAQLHLLSSFKRSKLHHDPSPSRGRDHNLLDRC